jgi:hypothetical protein
VLIARLIKNWVLKLSYLRTIQFKWKCNSYYNAWYYIQWSHKGEFEVTTFMNSVWHWKWVLWHMNKWLHISVLKFFEYIALDSWKMWTASLSLPCAVTCTLWRNDSIYFPFRTANNTIFIYICNEIHNICIWNDVHNRTLCYVQHIRKKLLTSTMERKVQWHFQTHPCCFVSFSFARKTSVHAYIKWNP